MTEQLQGRPTQPRLQSWRSLRAWHPYRAESGPTVCLIGAPPPPTLGRSSLPLYSVLPGRPGRRDLVAPAPP